MAASVGFRLPFGCLLSMRCGRQNEYGQTCYLKFTFIPQIHSMFDEKSIDFARFQQVKVFEIVLINFENIFSPIWIPADLTLLRHQNVSAPVVSYIFSQTAAIFQRPCTVQESMNCRFALAAKMFWIIFSCTWNVDLYFIFWCCRRDWPSWASLGGSVSMTAWHSLPTCHHRLTYLPDPSCKLSV